MRRRASKDLSPTRLITPPRQPSTFLTVNHDVISALYKLLTGSRPQREALHSESIVKKIARHRAVAVITTRVTKGTLA